MAAEDKLINDFYIEFWIYFGCTIVFAVMLLLIILFRHKFINDPHYKEPDTGKIVFTFFVLLISSCLVFFSYKFVVFSFDLQDVKQRNFEEITATAIRYSWVGEYSSPKKPSYGFPIFEIAGTGEKIKLSVGLIKLRETYKLIYLKNSKLARVVEGMQRNGIMVAPQ